MLIEWTIRMYYSHYASYQTKWYWGVPVDYKFKQQVNESVPLSLPKFLMNGFGIVKKGEIALTHKEPQQMKGKFVDYTRYC